MNPERKVKLPLKAKVAAAVSVSTAALLSACGGGEKEAAVQNPSSTIEPTASSVSYTPEPTPVITESPTPTPEPTPVPIPEVDRLAVINAVISEVQNRPVPVGMSADSWEIAKLGFLDGTEDQGGNHGLLDLKAVIEAGQLEDANKMFTENVLKYVLFPMGDEPTRVLTKEEINAIDPQHLLIGESFVSYPVFEPRFELGKSFIGLKYSLQK